MPPLKIIPIMACALALASCQTTATPTETKALVQQLPADYKAQIKEKIKTTLYDPYAVRDAEITEPTAIFTGLADGMHAPGVCIRFFGKNAFGAYIGQQTFSVSFRDGKVYRIMPPVYTCTDVVWRPFPELNGAH